MTRQSAFEIIGWGDTQEEAELMIKPTAELIYERFGNLVVGEGTDDVAEGLVAQLARTGSTLATAESCTGGLIAHLITAIAGVSTYYQGGVVSYANTAKSELLGVSPHLIESHGAVSAEVAAAMAEGVRNRLSADIGISTTGVAGPGGGTPEKPVGLVYVGLATAHGTRDAPARYRLGAAAGGHPVTIVESCAQLGEIESNGGVTKRLNTEGCINVLSHRMTAKLKQWRDQQP